jgi:two-component system sensor histidine kinase KdpD
VKPNLGLVARRVLLALAGVALITFTAFRLIPVNPTTTGFAYLLFVLIIASTWGLVEASIASIAATLCFNFFFLPPVGEFTIADPQNWVALFSFLATALVASRLSDRVKKQALEAMERQHDVERLYTFSRAILLIDSAEPVPKQLAQKLADIFELSAAVLYDRHSGEIYRAGPSDFEGLEDQLRKAAVEGSSFSDPERKRVITTVRLGSEPIASLAIQGASMPDSVLQGIANLIAIGLERARAQDLAHQMEAARRSEQLRSTLIDAMAHEFKTPLTSIKAVTTALLDSPDQSLENRTELLKVADEEAEHLRELIDDSLEMARLTSQQIEIHREATDAKDLVRDLIASMRTEIEDRPMEVVCDGQLPPIPVDRRLWKLALKQVLDNALKYSPPGSPVTIRVHDGGGTIHFEVTDHGEGIPTHEQNRIFDRFYRGPSVKNQIPGSGLGLSIANNIAQAHRGALTVTSHPGETTFHLTLPLATNENPGEPER